MNDTDERASTTTVVNNSNTYPAERRESPVLRHASTTATLIFILACIVGALALLVLALGAFGRAWGWAF